MEKILIIDDDQHISMMLATLVRRMGCEAVSTKTLGEGMALVRQEFFSVVLLDVNMPDGNGLDIISEIRKTQDEPEVIIMTGFGSSDGAEIAIRNGAWDYIQKGGAIQDVTLSLKRALEYHRQKSTRPKLVALKLNGIIGQSKPMKACYDEIARIAESEANVLITGETGTGKEVFARAIHANSRRSVKSLVVVDCAALPETLVESLLFGHEKGAYTGAESAREGLVAQADGGTLFLDEVGELPMSIQKVFLRVLQERRFRPVGGRQERPSNFRLIAATNRDLEQMVAEGRFRKDLLYRIRGMALTLPPLRERTEDIKPLAEHYLSKLGERYGEGNKGISPDFFETLMRYGWPGNVRELINAIETALANAGPEQILFSRNLPANIRLHAIQQNLDRTPRTEAARSQCSGCDDFGDELESFKTFKRAFVVRAEKHYLQTLLNASRNSMDSALRISGLSRSRFYDLLKQHNLSFMQ